MFFLKEKISKITRLAGALLLPALLFASCSDEIDNPVPGESGPKSGFITLTLRDKALSSRASEDDVDALNENLISTALVCIYPNGATDDAQPAIFREFTLSANTSATIEFRLNRELLSALFSTDATSCRAYVVANLPEGTVIPDNKSIRSLQNISIEDDFASSKPRQSFVMDGSAELTLAGDRANPPQCTVSGNVDLRRAASKIRLGVKIPDSVVDNGATWIPATEQMSVLITDGVGKAKVTPDARPGDDISEPYFSTATNAENPDHRARILSEVTGAEYPFQLAEPFYTFPNSWSGSDDNMTYMVLTVPFQKDGSETWRTCYYTVPVVRDNAIGRNVSYMVNVNVNILGSFNPDEPLELTDLSYKAIEWSQENIDVEIQDYRYLVLDQTEYAVNNEADINVPFYSSHETVIKEVKFKYYLYNTSAAGLRQEVSVSEAVNKKSDPQVYDTKINNTVNSQTNARTLTFSHELKELVAYNSRNRVVSLSGTNGSNYPSNITSNINSIDHYGRANPEVEAFSRFEIEITIVHADLKDDPSTPFQRTIKITQYPAMYIEADPNNYTFSGGQPYGSPALGNVYINGSQSGGGTMTPSGLTGTNRNPNMYVINVTQLSSSRYRIGDPRVTTINNLNYDNWKEASALFGTSPRKLSFYYPTDVSETMKMTIAPKFRVASSYGVSPTMNKTTAQRRCASYQEKDRPAGRWRLPTYAEMEFIINLSNTNKIPILFTSTYTYWNAQGSSKGQVTDGVLAEPGTTNGNVRCVYDEWYWESIKPVLTSDGTETSNNVTYAHYPFKWGDKAR